MPSPFMANPSIALRAAAVAGAAGAACVAYGVVVEHRWYREQRYTLPVLPPDAEPLTLLHLSDLHFVPKDERKARFLAALPRPDVTRERWASPWSTPPTRGRSWWPWDIAWCSPAIPMAARCACRSSAPWSPTGPLRPSWPWAWPAWDRDTSTFPRGWGRAGTRRS